MMINWDYVNLCSCILISTRKFR